MFLFSLTIYLLFHILTIWVVWHQSTWISWRKIWEWCLKRNIFVSASFIPGLSNLNADFNSRNFSDSTEWMLKIEIFQRLCLQTFFPDIDLFASRLNYQVAMFVSWFPEPGAWRYDAFSFSWKELSPYIFAPFSLIDRVLNKIIEDEVSQALLVVPHWVSQTWFPVLLSLCIDFPIRIPRHRDLTTSVVKFILLGAECLWLV